MGFLSLCEYPCIYQTYNFSITKPLNWNIISIASPNGFEVPYSFGGINDSWVSVNSTYAGIDGWWHIQGISSNWLSLVTHSFGMELIGVVFHR